MICVLYVTIAGLFLGTAGVLAERALPIAGRRRWLWVGIIVVSIAVPATYQSGHSATVASLMAAMGVAVTPATHAAWEHGLHALTPFVGIVWFVGSTMVLGLLALEALNLARRSAGRPVLVDGIRVVLTRRTGPATAGVFRPRILIPAWILGLPPAARRYALRHEEEHRRSGDVWLLHASAFALLLLPWNLPLWWQVRRLSLAVELDCDYRVVRALGDAPRYAEILVDLAGALGASDLQPALAGRAGSLEARLRVLLHPEARSGTWRTLMLFISASLVAAVLALPHPVLGASGRKASPSARHSTVYLGK